MSETVNVPQIMNTMHNLVTSFDSVSFENFILNLRFNSQYLLTIALTHFKTFDRQRWARVLA